ncbi:MAG: glycosyltransferase family 2 protein [Euryarchaeota archaeon]|nr:glycosyltransferase family 2 protein [Euryarchaeota archaeon]
MKVSVVIPTLNEEAGIGPTLDAIDREAFRSRGWDLELVIVDGASKDRTQEEATERGARVIVEPRKGYGRAYKTGFRDVDGDIIVTGDADTTYPFDQVHKYIQILKDSDLDFITTNRFGHLDQGAMSFRNRLGNRVLTLALQSLFWKRVRDSQSGMWIFRRSVLDRMTPLERFSDGMPFSEEIKVEAFCRKDIKAIEIPIEYKERTGEVKLEAWGDGWKNLGYLFKKRLTFRKGRTA